MSDAELAAVAALIGVSFTGGVQVALKAWEDHKTRRAALRPVKDELGQRLVRLQQDMRLLLLVGSLPDCPAWAKHRDVLARELSEKKWEKIAVAYSAYELVSSQIVGFEANAQVSAADALRMLKASIDYARVSVRAGYEVLAGRRETAALIAAVPQGAVKVTTTTASAKETTVVTLDRDAEADPPPGP